MPVKKVKNEERQKEVQVKMIREDGKTANVHPAEVENFKKGGYTEVK